MFSFMRELVPLQDRFLLLGCIGGSILTYNAIRLISSISTERKKSKEWIPVVYYLWRSLCRFYTARTHPRLVLIEADVRNGQLLLSTLGGKSLVVVLSQVLQKKDVRRATLHDKLQADGLDCGDAAAKFIQDFMQEDGMRLLMYAPNLFNGRPCVSEQEWWDNPVPQRNDTVAYVDLAPYMITTEGSLKELNQRLSKKVTSLNFRPNIVIDESAAWDEDRWSDLRMGDVQLECFKPCTRCVLTTVDPCTGKKDLENQPLKELRKFRLAPEGKLRDAHGDSPIFGVNAGITRPGYIHVGQVVWARYKPTVF